MEDDKYVKQEKFLDAFPEQSSKKLKLSNESQVVQIKSSKHLFLTPLLAKMQKEKLLNAPAKQKTHENKYTLEDLEQVKKKLLFDTEPLEYSDEEYQTEESRNELLATFVAFGL